MSIYEISEERTDEQKRNHPLTKYQDQDEA